LGYRYDEGRLIKIVGERIREVREGRGMSKEELSRESGLSHKAIVKIESGEG